MASMEMRANSRTPIVSAEFPLKSAHVLFVPDPVRYGYSILLSLPPYCRVKIKVDEVDTEIDKDNNDCKSEHAALDHHNVH